MNGIKVGFCVESVGEENERGAAVSGSLEEGRL